MAIKEMEGEMGFGRSYAQDRKEGKSPFKIIAEGNKKRNSMSDRMGDEICRGGHCEPVRVECRKIRAEVVSSPIQQKTRKT